jgi:LPS-assembly lipoprotein
MNRRACLFALPALLTAGCGFQLRRAGGVPFASLYVEAPPGSAVAQRLVAALRSGGSPRMAASAAEGEVVVVLSPEERSKTILALSGAGRVTEYRLGLRLTYTIRARDARVLAAPDLIELSRDMTYDDSQLLAKYAEEQLLYRDMDDNAALRILRRLQSVNPGNGR